MGFFALLRRPGDGHGLCVRRCHLNFWAIDRRIGGYRLIWDLGVLFEQTGQDGPFSFQVALPFGTTEGAFSDLSKHLTDRSTAEQIFGEPVQVDGDRVRIPSYGDDPITIGRLARDQVSREGSLSGGDFSVWNVNDVNWPAAGGFVYLRLRFAIAVRGTLWDWRPSIYSRSAVLVDLRVSDVRGVTNERWRALEERILEIGHLNAFVIVPIGLHPQAYSPDFRYARLLEPDVWKGYLGGSPRSKLVIYHWRPRANDANPGRVNIGSPFLGFLHLRLMSDGKVGQAARSAVMVILAYTLISMIFGETPAWVGSAKKMLAEVYQFASTGTVIAVATGSVVLINWLLKLRVVGGSLIKIREAWAARDWRRIF